MTRLDKWAKKHGYYNWSHAQAHGIMIKNVYKEAKVKKPELLPDSYCMTVTKNGEIIERKYF